MMLRFNPHMLKSTLVAMGYLLITLSINGLHTHGLVRPDASHCQCNRCKLVAPSNHDNPAPAKHDCPACKFLLTAQSDVPAPILFVAWHPVSVSPRAEQAELPSALLVFEHPARAPPATC